MKEDYRKFIENHKRNAINILIGENADYKLGTSHFGGKPDLPSTFKWPVYMDKGINAEPYPLAFLAQFNCEELHKYDSSGVLPQNGLLSFFYDIEGQPWGLDKEDRGSAHVFLFEDISSLRETGYPDNVNSPIELPSLKIKFESANSYPGWEEYNSLNQNMSSEDIKEYCDVLKEFGYESIDARSKLLGWADVIQDSMIQTCEKMVSKEKINDGFVLFDKWQLLLQLNSIINENFELLFGDCGNIYFYINKNDLINKNFESSWAILQC